MPKIYGSSEIWGDLLVTGSFSILGSASTINTTNLTVSDTIITLGHSQSGSPILDEGIMFARGTGLTQAFIWDESDDTFALIGTNDDHTVIGDININSYSNLRVGGFTASTLRLINGAASGYLLQSDASGNATWVSSTSSSANFANTDLTFTGNRSHNTAGNSLEITTDGGVYAQSYFVMYSGSMGFGNNDNEISINTSSTTFNAGGNDVDFRIEGLTNSSLFFVDASNDRIGIGTNTPSSLFHLYYSSDSQLRYDPTYLSGVVRLDGDVLPSFSINIPASGLNPTTGGSIGMRSWTDSSYPGYGDNGDMYIYASNDTNGLNIINRQGGVGCPDYIRFYAGQDANGTTPDIHIQGDGTTRGNVGIGNSSPSYKLEVSGTVSTTGFRMTNGANTGYVLTSDASGNATWATPVIPVNIYSSTQSYTSGTTYSINHGLNTNSIVLNLWDEITGELVVANVIKTGTNTIDLNSTVTLSSGRVVVIGG